MEKQRIDFVDLAKGFCIVLVVFTHVNGFCFQNQHYALSEALMSFRMPLYFFLSGLFFKKYESFLGFFKRKTNKLLIPFFFFFLTTSFLLPLLMQMCGYELRNEYGIGIHTLYAFIYPETFSNTPIWFLMCLFVVNIMFYLVLTLSEKLTIRFRVGIIWCLIGLSVITGLCGYCFSQNEINLPMYIDSAMTALPFFLTGFLSNKYSDILRPSKYDKLCLPVSAILLSITVLIACKVDYRGNVFPSGSLVQIYVCGICGTLSIIFISKVLHRLPLVSYWGRYSIMILCTHILIMNVVSSIIKRFDMGVWPQIFITTAIVLLSYMVIIPFMKRFMPHVTAQKDVIAI